MLSVAPPAGRVVEAYPNPALAVDAAGRAHVVYTVRRLDGAGVEPAQSIVAPSGAATTRVLSPPYPGVVVGGSEVLLDWRVWGGDMPALLFDATRELIAAGISVSDDSDVHGGRR